ncbi:class I SAM-dependent methyltransferase [Candidatus Calescamantes bacterium]|nr:class I SAM-dependent methyltransferase [Candidatus Calescamantes bacterium]
MPEKLLDSFIDHILQAPFNVTSIKTRERINDILIIPSLDLIPFLSHGPLKIADGGTGAGIPGVPLALALPASHFHLIESVRKKADYLKGWVRKNRIANITVHKTRVENTPIKVDIGIARGMATLDKVLENFSGIIKSRGLLYVQCGERVEAIIKNESFILKNDKKVGQMRLLIYERF